MKTETSPKGLNLRKQTGFRSGFKKNELNLQGH